MPNRPGIVQRVLGRSPAATEDRSLWSRTGGDLLANDPAQVVWLGSDQWPGVLGAGAEAEALPVTTRATSLVTGPLTSAPYRLVDDATGGDLPTPRWIGDPMLLRPDGRLTGGLAAIPHARRLTRSGFWREVIRSAVWHGAGAFVYQVGSDGSPVAGNIRQVHPGTLSVGSSGNWELGTEGDRIEFDREGRASIGGVEYGVAVVRNPLSPVGADGVSRGVFGLSPSAFKTAAAVDAYTAGTFRSGVPAGYLTVKNPQATPAQVSALKSEWMAAHGGDTRSIAALTSMVDFTPISWSPHDAEATAIKRMAISDVAYAFGLPPEVLGVSPGNSATYVNVTDAWDRLKAFGLSVWISELEDVLSSLVPYGRSVRLDLSEFETETTPGQPARGRLAGSPAPPPEPTDPQTEEVAP